MILLKKINNKNGFTLIEIMAVMVILGVMTSIFIKKINQIGDTADTRAIDVGISELNAREMLVWTNQKFAVGGYGANGGDEGVFGAIVYDLGHGYRWTAGDPVFAGGRISFGSKQNVQLTRTESSDTGAARWSR